MDCEVERLGAGSERRLWSLWSQVQLSLTPKQRSTQRPGGSEADGKRHGDRRGNPCDVAGRTSVQRAVGHLHGA